MGGTRQGWLDGLRGYAALVVVLFHLSPVVLGPAAHLTFWRHLDLGKYGVLLFFLVSGYVIPMSLERSGSLRRFWVGRLCRVYPAYLAAIALLVVLGGRPGGLLAHASMLLDPLGRRGAVRVFWTLSYEMIFYLVVAGLYAWRLHRHSAWWACGLAATAVVLGPVLPDGLLGAGQGVAAVVLVLVAASVGGHLLGRHRAAGLIGIGFMVLPAINGHPTAMSTVAGSWEALLFLAVMFAGTVIYRARHGEIGRWPAWSTLAAVAVALVVAHPDHTRWAATMAAVAGTFAVAFACRRRRVPTALGFLGTISYSLYLLHVVVLTVFLRLMPGLAGRPAGVRVLVGAAFLASAVTVSWLAYKMIEVPGRRLGRKIFHHRACHGAHGPGRDCRYERLGSMGGQGQRVCGQGGRMSERSGVVA